MLSELRNQIEAVRSGMKSELGQELMEASKFALLLLLICMATINPINELLLHIWSYLVRIS